MKTLVMERMPDLFWQQIKKNGYEQYFIEKTELKLAEILIIRTYTKIDRKLLANLPALKMIIRAGSGVDNIDIKATSERNIIVCNTPEANAISAYEHTLAFIFALLKKQQFWKNSVLSGKWKEDSEPNWEFSEIKALIVGVGRVGSRVAKFLKLTGAKVKGVDPYLTDAEWKVKEVESIDYKQGLNWCNLLSFHCPLNEETLDYFSKKELNELSGNIWLINTARGKIVNESAVAKGLQQKKILGYAADVFPQEPCIVSNFYDKDNVYLSPHVGAFTRKAKKRLAIETLKVWEDYILHDLVTNRINFFQ